MKTACTNPTTDLVRLERLHNYGFDGYEANFSLIAPASVEQMKELRAKSDQLGMPCVSANGMFPGNIKLLRGKEGYGEISEYLESTFEKAKIIDLPVVVLGSGGARTIPEGMSYGEATEKFLSLLSDIIAPASAKYGIPVAIEELSAKECNFINSCREVAEMIKAVNRPEIKLLVDYYHAMNAGDTLEEIASYGDMIAHVHVSSVIVPRAFPSDVDLEDYRKFVSALKSAGYTGSLSVEANQSSAGLEADSRKAVEILKKAQI